MIINKDTNQFLIYRQLNIRFFIQSSKTLLVELTKYTYFIFILSHLLTHIEGGGSALLPAKLNIMQMQSK